MDDKFRQNFIQQTVLTGVFYDAVINRPAGQTKKEALQNAATTFDPFTEEDFETVFKDKYHVANWLRNNKETLNSEQVYERLQSCRPISNGNMERLWDNLYYHFSLQLPSYYESIINALLAVQHVITNLETTDETDILRLANAKVLLPEKIFKEDYASPL